MEHITDERPNHCMQPRPPAGAADADVSHIMNKHNYMIALMICVGLGTFIILIDGFAGVRLILVLTLCYLFVDLLSQAFVKQRWRFPRTLLAGLPASVMIVAVFLFSLALVKGADTVASMPHWVWEGIVVYSGVAIGLTIRLSDIPDYNGSPLQPPPSRERRA